jgi:hypothetical protein
LSSNLAHVVFTPLKYIFTSLKDPALPRGGGNNKVHM